MTLWKKKCSFHCLIALLLSFFTILSAGRPSLAETAGKRPSACTEIKCFETRLRRAVRPADTKTRYHTLNERMTHYGVPGVSIAVLSGGEVIWAKGYGIAKEGSPTPIDTETIFSVGSLSKTGAALAAVRLVDQGKLTLDDDINSTLKTWKMPVSGKDSTRAISLRMLLSHTAGLNVHGFDDFGPNEPLPTTLQILNGQKPAKSEAVRLIHEPGTVYNYSGGGTTIAGLMVAESFGSDFPTAANALVFEPLNMARTTFEVPLPVGTENIAYAHNKKGKLTAKPRGYHSFPETAASGLWSTPTEYGRMLNALLKAYKGEDQSFLSRETAIETLTPVRPSIHALGPVIAGNGLEQRMQHTGSNESYKAIYDVSLTTGNGAIIFTNGSRGYLLYREIMNALSDVMGWGFYPEIVTSVLPKKTLTPKKGKYRLDRTEDRFGLLPDADYPDEIELSNKGNSLLARARINSDASVEQFKFLSVSPTFFVSPDGRWKIRFYRDTEGEVVGLSLKKGLSTHGEGYLPIKYKKVGN